MVKASTYVRHSKPNFSGTGCRSGGGLTVEEPLGSIKPGRFEATQAPSLGRKKKKILN